MLLAGDLKDRAHRLQTRQQGELERARRKAEKDAILAERAKQRQLAHEDELRKQRLAQQESREAVRTLSKAFSTWGCFKAQARTCIVLQSAG